MDLTVQIPMQYCSWQHQTLLPSPVTSTTGCFYFGLVSSFFLELFLHWSPVAIRHLPTWGVHLSVSYLFGFSYYSWGSPGKNAEVVCHSLLQRTTFCQNSPPWPLRLGWPCTAQLIVPLSSTRLFWLKTRIKLEKLSDVSHSLVSWVRTLWKFPHSCVLLLTWYFCYVYVYILTLKYVFNKSLYWEFFYIMLLNVKNIQLFWASRI